MNIVVVVDKERITLGAFLAVMVSRRTFPDAIYHFAAPERSPFLRSDTHQRLADKLQISVRVIPAPGIDVEGRAYRIINKVQALASFESGPALLTDSDVFFVRPLPTDYLAWRTCPAAVPEHGIQSIDWARLYASLSLPVPTTRHLCGNGGASLPWFNAGLVYAPDPQALGSLWLQMCHRVNGLDWLPKRFPYLDQYALPLAMALLSPETLITPASVLDFRLNQNLFHWHANQSYIGLGIGVHHHGRLSLVKRYLPDLLPWVRTVHPSAGAIIDQYAALEPASPAPA